MSGSTRKLVLVALVLLAGGCERPSEREPQEQDKALLRAIEAPQERARAVEGDVQEAKERADAAIEAQGG